MAHTIWKFPVQDAFTLELPIGARFLDVQVQAGVPQFWFLLDPNGQREIRKFAVAGTGAHISNPEMLEHLGTFQLHEGRIVLHLFELR